MTIYYPSQLGNIKHVIEERLKAYKDQPITEQLLKHLEHVVKDVLNQRGLSLDIYLYSQNDDIYISLMDHQERTDLSTTHSVFHMPYMNITDLDRLPEVTWTYSDSTQKVEPSEELIEPEEELSDVEVLASILDMLEKLTCREDITRILSTINRWFDIEE